MFKTRTDKKSRVFSMLCALAILSAGFAGVRQASAYITAHADTGGYVQLDLDDTYTRLEDTVANWEKQVSVVNTGDAACKVRAKFFVAEKYKDYVAYSSASALWSLNADGYWYFDKILEPGESTAVLTAKLDQAKFSKDFTENTSQDFNIIVVHEYARVQYDSSGGASVDWNEKVVVSD